MTPGYAHVSWEIMVRAVEALEQPVPAPEIVFGLDSGRIPANTFWSKKRVEGK